MKTLKIIFVALFGYCCLIHTGCTFFDQHRAEPKNQRNTAIRSDRLLTPQEAQKALIEMTKASNFGEWGGTPVDHELILLDLDMETEEAQLIKKLRKPIPRKPVPAIMNEIEELEDGSVRIGFWTCDLTKTTFYSARSNSHSYICYEGFFLKDGSGKWYAEFYLGAHGIGSPEQNLTQ